MRGRKDSEILDFPPTSQEKINKFSSYKVITTFLHFHSFTQIISRHWYPSTCLWPIISTKFCKQVSNIIWFVVFVPLSRHTNFIDYADIDILYSQANKMILATLEISKDNEDEMVLWYASRAISAAAESK